MGILDRRRWRRLSLPEMAPFLAAADRRSEGVRCNFHDQALDIAIFTTDLSEEMLHPGVVHLGLTVHERAILLTVKIGEKCADCPYYHPSDVLPELVPEGLGLACSIAVCDIHGICKAFAVRSLTNKFSNALINAIRQQGKLSEADNYAAVQSAYAKWNSEQMHEAAICSDSGWTSLGAAD
jgi:hypothetical protein